MVNAVPAAARRAPLQPTQLRSKPGYVQQLRPPAVQDRKEVAVNVRLRLLRKVILDAVGAKALPRPLPGVAVALDAMHPVGFQQRREVLRHALGA